MSEPPTIEDEVPDPCSICTVDLAHGQVSILGCGHSYHTLCIDEWLNKCPTCPMCRARVSQPAAAEQMDVGWFNFFHARPQNDPEVEHHIRTALDEVMHAAHQPAAAAAAAPVQNIAVNGLRLLHQLHQNANVLVVFDDMHQPPPPPPPRHEANNNDYGLYIAEARRANPYKQLDRQAQKSLARAQRQQRSRRR
jgi:hypothetical protein